jgi:hypothetical protein
MVSFMRPASVVLILLILLPARALGQCQCPPPELLAAYVEAELVFQAAVGSVSKVHPGEGLELSLELRRSWKGQVGAARTVWMPRGAAPEGCQQVLESGKEYLFLVADQGPIRPTGCLGSLVIALDELPRGWEAFLEAVDRGARREAAAN